MTQCAKVSRVCILDGDWPSSLARLHDEIRDVIAELVDLIDERLRLEGFGVVEEDPEREREVEQEEEDQQEAVEHDGDERPLCGVALVLVAPSLLPLSAAGDAQ